MALVLAATTIILPVLACHARLRRGGGHRHERVWHRRPGLPVLASS